MEQFNWRSLFFKALMEAKYGEKIKVALVPHIFVEYVLFYAGPFWYFIIIYMFSSMNLYSVVYSSECVCYYEIFLLKALPS